MVLQVMWLFISYALVLSAVVLLLELDLLLWAVVVLVGLPALRIYRRFGVGRGYVLPGRRGSVGEIPKPTIRATRQEHPLLFGAFLVLELLVLAFFVVSVAMNPELVETEALVRFRECTLGDGASEVCF